MNELPDAKILILASQSGAAQRWADILRGPGVEVCLGRDETGQMPPEMLPEVIVTDTSVAAEHGTGPAWAEAASGMVGVVQIGAEGPADVTLPWDVPPSELRLACRLLAEIVRLRRRERSEAELRHQLSEKALTDPLTGLPNRREWDDTLPRKCAAAAEGQAPNSPRLCLAIFDLDHFKRINDAQGHAVGDRVLRAAARTIRNSLREEDFVARLGGDEFGLLLWVPHEAAAASVIDRVRAALPSRLLDRQVPAVTASAGYRVTSDHSSAPLPSPDALYSAADASLREAKRQGRDRTVGQ